MPAHTKPHAHTHEQGLPTVKAACNIKQESARRLWVALGISLNTLGLPVILTGLKSRWEEKY
jgi:hypothetical protein